MISYIWLLWYSMEEFSTPTLTLFHSRSVSQHHNQSGRCKHAHSGMRSTNGLTIFGCLNVPVMPVSPVVVPSELAVTYAWAEEAVDHALSCRSCFQLRIQSSWLADKWPWSEPKRNFCFVWDLFCVIPSEPKLVKNVALNSRTRLDFSYKSAFLLLACLVSLRKDCCVFSPFFIYIFIPLCTILQLPSCC